MVEVFAVIVTAIPWLAVGFCLFIAFESLIGTDRLTTRIRPKHSRRRRAGKRNRPDQLWAIRCVGGWLALGLLLVFGSLQLDLNPYWTFHMWVIAVVMFLGLVLFVFLPVALLLPRISKNRGGTSYRGSGSVGPVFGSADPADSFGSGGDGGGGGGG